MVKTQTGEQMCAIKSANKCDIQLTWTTTNCGAGSPTNKTSTAWKLCHAVCTKIAPGSLRDLYPIITRHQPRFQRKELWTKLLLLHHPGTKPNQLTKFEQNWPTSSWRKCCPQNLVQHALCALRRCNGLQRCKSPKMSFESKQEDTELTDWLLLLSIARLAPCLPASNIPLKSDAFRRKQQEDTRPSTRSTSTSLQTSCSVSLCAICVPFCQSTCTLFTVRLHSVLHASRNKKKHRKNCHRNGALFWGERNPLFQPWICKSVRARSQRKIFSRHVSKLVKATSHLRRTRGNIVWEGSTLKGHFSQVTPTGAWSVRFCCCENNFKFHLACCSCVRRPTNWAAAPRNLSPSLVPSRMKGGGVTVTCRALKKLMEGGEGGTGRGHHWSDLWVAQKFAGKVGPFARCLTTLVRKGRTQIVQSQ